MTYPDGEIVKYTYDNGGLLTHIENTDGQVYLKSICYDKFEQRSTMVYGNNTTTNYIYDPQQLLNTLTVSSSINNVFMNNKYDYDLNFNIINIENTSSSVA